MSSSVDQLCHGDSRKGSSGPAHYRSRFCNLPFAVLKRSLHRMRFGVEDYAIEIECLLRCEQQVEILERLGEQKALHRIVLLFRNDTLQSRVTFISAAILHEVAPHRFAPTYVVRI